MCHHFAARAMVQAQCRQTIGMALPFATTTLGTSIQHWAEKIRSLLNETWPKRTLEAAQMRDRPICAINRQAPARHMPATHRLPFAHSGKRPTEGLEHLLGLHGAGQTQAVFPNGQS